MRIKTKEALIAYLFCLPSFIGFAFFFIIPFGVSIYYCFTQGVGGADFVGFKNFTDLLQSRSFLLAFKNTMIFNAISVPAIMLVSFLFALLLNNDIRFRTWFRTFFIVPLVVPVASVILVWNILFDVQGVVNQILLAMNAAPVEWLRSQWAVAILGLLYIWKNCGYNVVLFLAGLNNIPKEYYECARIDGAGPWTCLSKITLPFLMPTGFFVFVISIINSFKVFREAYLLAGTYPYQDIYLLQHFMNNNFFHLNYPRLTTAASLIALIVFLLVYLLFYLEHRFSRSL